MKKIALLLVSAVTGSVFIANALGSNTVAMGISHRHNSLDRWYECTACGKIALNGNLTNGRCPKLNENAHQWKILTEAGNKTYVCDYCAATITSPGNPGNGKCLKNLKPNVDGLGGLHSWRQTSGGAVNKF